MVENRNIKCLSKKYLQKSFKIMKNILAFEFE